MTPGISSLKRLFFDSARTNEGVLRAGVKPVVVLVWTVILAVIVWVTYLDPVQTHTGLQPLTVALVLLPMAASYLLHALYVRLRHTPAGYRPLLVWSGIAACFLVIVTLITTAGQNAWSLMWIGYLLYIVIVTHAAGLQLSVALLILAAGMAPWALFAAAGLPPAGPWLASSLASSGLGLVAYGLLGSVMNTSQRYVVLRQNLEHERLLSRQTEKIWREIHDGVGSHLSVALMGNRVAAGALKAGPVDAPRICALIEDSVESLENALFEMHECIDISRRTAEWTLGELADHIRHSFSVPLENKGAELGIAVNESGPGPFRLPLSYTHALRRVVQEAISNILRHSDATVVEVRMTRSARNLFVHIADNGTGGSVSKAGTGLGIESMRRRVAEIGGTLEVNKVAEGGITVFLQVPCPHSA